MSRPVRIVCSVGTRPEAIKMAPVVQALRRAAWCDVTLMLTSQHRDLVEPVLDTFGLVADDRLDAMAPGQSLHDLTAKILAQSAGILARRDPDLVLVHGDTTSAFAVALSAFYLGIDVAHVEAGLRTDDMQHPFPEEANRSMIARLARLHFAPTQAAADNLAREGTDPARIFVTGNTIFDALMTFGAADGAAIVGVEGRRVIVTAHRRENHGAPFDRICAAIIRLARLYPSMSFVFVLHPNPLLKHSAEAHFGGIANIHLLPPLDYPRFIAAMKGATLILSDSGGVQEEAPALGVPLVLLREKTERPEALLSDLVTLAGTDSDAIVAAARHWLDSPPARSAVEISGAGASARIVAVIERHYSSGAEKRGAAR